MDTTESMHTAIKRYSRYTIDDIRFGSCAYHTFLSPNNTSIFTRADTHTPSTYFSKIALFITYKIFLLESIHANALSYVDSCFEGTLSTLGYWHSCTLYAGEYAYSYKATGTPLYEDLTNTIITATYEHRSHYWHPLF